MMLYIKIIGVTILLLAYEKYSRKKVIQFKKEFAQKRYYK